jgi:hypothetical protein
MARIFRSRALPLLAALAAIAALGGCVVYPGYGYPGPAYGYGYGYPYYAFPSIGFNFGGWGHDRH